MSGFVNPAHYKTAHRRAATHTHTGAAPQARARLATSVAACRRGWPRARAVGAGPADRPAVFFLRILALQRRGKMGACCSCQYSNLDGDSVESSAAVAYTPRQSHAPAATPRASAGGAARSHPVSASRVVIMAAEEDDDALSKRQEAFARRRAAEEAEAKAKADAAAAAALLRAEAEAAAAAAARAEADARREAELEATLKRLTERAGGGGRATGR